MRSVKARSAYEALRAALCAGVGAATVAAGACPFGPDGGAVGAVRDGGLDVEPRGGGLEGGGNLPGMGGGREDKVATSLVGETENGRIRGA